MRSLRCLCLLLACVVTFCGLFSVSTYAAEVDTTQAENPYSPLSYYTLDVPNADFTIIFRVPFALDRLFIIVCPDDLADPYGDCTIHVITHTGYWLSASGSSEDHIISTLEVYAMNGIDIPPLDYTLRTASIRSSMASIVTDGYVEISFPDVYEESEHYAEQTRFTFSNVIGVFGFGARENNIVVPLKFVYVPAPPTPIGPSDVVPVIDAYADQLTVPLLVGILAGAAGVSVGLVFLWWGARKVKAAFMKAFKSGKLRI